MDFLTQTDVVVLAMGTLILGMVILIKGGNWTIDGAVEIARYYGMPPLLVGFTIVAFGTSLPELIASINANLKGAPTLAVGNVIGSNIANILLIGGVSAFIAPLAANMRDIRNDMVMMLIASGLWIYALLSMSIGVAVGATAMGVLVGYVFVQYQLTKTNKAQQAVIMKQEKEAEKIAPTSHNKAIFMVLGGLVGLALGAELLIRGSVTTARILNIPDSVIGLTVIAIGTSLPELTTCAIAAMKKQSDVIIGNLVGSNVFNLMMILGSMGLVKAYNVQDETMMAAQDLPLMMGVSVIFALILMIFQKIPRFVGGVFVALYVAYLLLLAYQTL